MVGVLVATATGTVASDVGAMGAAPAVAGAGPGGVEGFGEVNSLPPGGAVDGGSDFPQPEIKGIANANVAIHATPSAARLRPRAGRLRGLAPLNRQGPAFSEKLKAHCRVGRLFLSRTLAVGFDASIVRAPLSARSPSQQTR